MESSNDSVSVFDLNLDDDWPIREIDSQSDDDDEFIENSLPDLEIFDLSQLDVDERAVIQSMYGTNCNSCCAQYSCNKVIPQELALKHRDQFTEMSKSEQNAIILAHLQQCRRMPALENHYGDLTKRGSMRKKSDTLQRMDVQYFFGSLPICKDMYFFLHDIGKFRYENLCKHFDAVGISPRVHKLSNKVPNRDNVLPPEYIKKVVTFIKSVADNYGLPLPGRLPQFKNFDVIKLPSNETKSSIHRKFCDAMTSEDPNFRKIDRSTFSKIWKKYCPYVTIIKPADDLCGTCRENHIEVMKAANMSDEVKTQKLQVAADHLNDARKQREFYNTWRKLSEMQTTYEDDGSQRSFLVLSFDFAENLNYPFSCQQIGPIYFKAPRKCGLFGVHDERNHHQANYLIDEGNSIGKGANTVISLLHHYLEKYRESVDTLILFSDNCVGQNKNNALMQYLLWRVLTGRNRKIVYNFLLVGHTKFSPDRSFGMLKKKYSKSILDSLEDIAACIESSSVNKLQSAIITYDPAIQEQRVTWSDWSQYLLRIFKTLPGLTQYHHFIFGADGSVRTKLYADSTPECIFLTRSDSTLEDVMMIEDIIPEGLSVERQWYLYENIRQYVINESKKDSVAPQPTEPKVKSSVNEPVAEACSSNEELKKVPLAERKKKQPATAEQGLAEQGSSKPRARRQQAKPKPSTVKQGSSKPRACRQQAKTKTSSKTTEKT